MVITRSNFLSWCSSFLMNYFSAAALAFHRNRMAKSPVDSRGVTEDEGDADHGHDPQRSLARCSVVECCDGPIPVVLALKIYYEERILRTRHSAYEAYVKKTKRLIPFLF